MRVLVTRPREDAGRTAELLAARGHRAVLAPLFEVRPLAAALPEAADSVLAASANAIRMADPAGLARLARARLFAVGSHTAEAARAAGFRDVAAGDGDAAGLAALVRRSCPPGARLLHLAGRPRRDEAIRALSGDYPMTVAEVYESVATPVLPSEAATALRAGEIDAVLHLSPRAARIFADLAESAGLLAAARRAIHVVISEAAADPRLANIRVADHPDLETVISAL
jgi:uroporphyrinogen-III synthase